MGPGGARRRIPRAPSHPTPTPRGRRGRWDRANDTARRSVRLRPPFDDSPARAFPLPSPLETDTAPARALHAPAPTLEGDIHPSRSWTSGAKTPADLAKARDTFFDRTTRARTISGSPRAIEPHLTRPPRAAEPDAAPRTRTSRAPTGGETNRGKEDAADSSVRRRPNRIESNLRRDAHPQRSKRVDPFQPHLLVAS